MFITKLKHKKIFNIIKTVLLFLNNEILFTVYQTSFTEQIITLLLFKVKKSCYRLEFPKLISKIAPLSEI